MKYQSLQISRVVKMPILLLSCVATEVVSFSEKVVITNTLPVLSLLPDRGNKFLYSGTYQVSYQFKPSLLFGSAIVRGYLVIVRGKEAIYEKMLPKIRLDREVMIANDQDQDIIAGIREGDVLYISLVMENSHWSPISIIVKDKGELSATIVTGPI